MNETPIIALENAILSAPFIALTDSKSYYPGSNGAGLALVVVSTELCSAVISLQGAQLLEFTGRDQQPLLWLSPRCNFTPGTALRGGMPICLPWFGVNQQDPTKPKHGFARNLDWELTSANLLDSGDAELVFRFISEPSELFRFAFTAEIIMTLGKKVKIDLRITNTDQRPFDCTWVLHTYFAVDDIDNVSVGGLEQQEYLDNLDGLTKKMQIGSLKFPQLVDRAFERVDNPILIHSSRSILITHRDCPSVVAWNPRAEAAKMADVGDGNERHFVCIERGAVFDSKWALSAGQTQSAWMEIAVIN